MPVYTRANLYDDIGRDVGAVTNIDRIVNRAARFVVGDIDLRSTKRRVYLSPSLNDDQYDYQAPADLKEFAIIDISRIEGREESDKFNFVSNDYFDRNKSKNRNIVTVQDRDWLKKVRISANLHDDTSEITIHECDSITADGTWSVSLDASNLTTDTSFFIHGSGSLNFDMDQAGTTTTVGIIVNSNFDQIDISAYTTSIAAIYAWIYAPTVTGLDGFTLRIGSDASNYFSNQATVTNENLAFHTGWMLIRWNMSDLTGSQTGTVDTKKIDYVRITIDKGNDSLQSKDWRLDFIQLRIGIPHEFHYYTKYAWQNTSATYLENSTAAGDLLNADTEEYELFILKGKELVSQDLKQFDDAIMFSKLYQLKKEDYLSKYPSERILWIQTNYKFTSDFSESIF